MYVLESDALLSRSMIWRLQRTFYADQGVAAWSHSRVPQSVTTSPNIAGAYARIALGFLHDMRSESGPRPTGVSGRTRRRLRSVW